VTSIDLASALFRPRAVALVGASDNPQKHTARPLRYLRSHGFEGVVVPVNPNRREVLGERAYATVEDGPEGVDHALVMVPGAQVAEVIRQCGRAGIALATIYSDGFAETGADGVKRQEELVAIARESGVRLVGPNSMGVLNTGNGMALTVNATLEQPHLQTGGLGVVSQSGSVMGALLSRGQARGLGVSKAVSVGNEADVCVGEIVDVLVDDEDTEAIVLFLESLRHSPVLARAARRAHEAGKPVIAYKLGRSRVGQALAATHSGAITGSAQAAREFFRANGILEVGMLETLLELPALVQGRSPPAGKRAAVLTTTGGGAAMVVDGLGEHGVDVVAAPAGLTRALVDMGVRLPASPLIDLTMAGARAPVYAAALGALLESPDIDIVVAVVGSSGQFHPEVAVTPIVEADRKKPVAVFIAPQADRSLELLAGAGVGGFRTPESCADAVSAYLHWRAPTPTPARRLVPSGLEERLAGNAGAAMNEVEAARCFDLLGIPQAPFAVIDEPGDVHGLRIPLAAKLLSAGVSHKTETGAVALDIADERSLIDTCRDMRHRFGQHDPGSRTEGFLIQEMQAGIMEVLVGYRDDPEVGPVVVVATGGTLAEVHADAALRLAPVGLESAEAMIGEVKGLAPIDGFRGGPRGDRAALADTIVALSDLARLPGRPVAEAEINPLVVKRAGEGVVAVDALLVPKAVA
jgi:acyl-CoA synthetase (NDP forming)